MDVSKVGKNLMGIGHVLVDIIKVGKQQLAPSVETVERLILTGDFRIGTIEVADQLDGVGNHQL